MFYLILLIILGLFLMLQIKRRRAIEVLEDCEPFEDNDPRLEEQRLPDETPPS